MTETEETLVYDAMTSLHKASTVLAKLVNLDGTQAARNAYKSGVYGSCVKLQCALGQEALDRGKARHERIKRDAAVYFDNAERGEDSCGSPCPALRDNYEKERSNYWSEPCSTCEHRHQPKGNPTCQRCTHCAR